MQFLLLLLLLNINIFAVEIIVTPSVLSSHFVNPNMDDLKMMKEPSLNFNQNHDFIGLSIIKNDFEASVATFKNSYYNQTETVSIGYIERFKYLDLVPEIVYQNGYTNIQHVMPMLWLSKDFKHFRVRATVTDKAFIAKFGIFLFKGK